MKGSPSRFVLTVALVSGLLAQTSTQVPAVTGVAGSSTSSDDAAARIQVTTRLVLLNVLVHNRGGKPVGGLTSADFEVTDAGRPQTITAFNVNQLPARGTRPATILPRNVVTNRLITQEGASPSVTVVLIDSYNTEWVNQGYVKRELLKCLSKILPEDQVAIYALSSKGFAIVHDFTNNAEGLKAATAKATPQSGHEFEGAAFDRANTGNDRINAMIDESNLIISNFLTGNRIVNTCAALRNLADHLSGIPGRKNLVWITGGVPMELFGGLQGSAGHSNRHFAPYVAEAAQALNNANVAVYPVDVPGVMNPSYQASQSRSYWTPDASLPTSRPPLARNPEHATSAPDRNPNTPTVPNFDHYIESYNVMTLAHLADMTGGKAFHDIAAAVRQAIDDSLVTYTLGYYVAASDWDNRYHKVKVSVRRSGVNVRTKKGYLAQDKPAPTSVQLDAALNDAVWSPLDSTRLTVTARIDPSPALPNASRLSVAINPAEVDVRQEDGTYRGGADLLFVQERKAASTGQG